MMNRANIHSRFSSNSAASASELLENLEDRFPHTGTIFSRSRTNDFNSIVITSTLQLMSNILYMINLSKSVKDIIIGSTGLSYNNSLIITLMTVLESYISTRIFGDK